MLFLVSKSLEEGIDLVFGATSSRSSSPSVLQTGSRAKLMFIDATGYSALKGQMSPPHNSYFTEMNEHFSITRCRPSKANGPHQPRDLLGVKRHI